MRLWPRRNREVLITSTDRDARPIVEGVAEMLLQNPEILRSYLIVGFRIDGTVAIAHNSCCVPHQVNRTIDMIHKYPELSRVREKYRESHGS